MTFVMIISDFGGQIHIFLSKYAYFAENATFDPPGCFCMAFPPGEGVLMYGLPPWCDGIFFEELLICFNFSMTFVMIF